MGHITLNCCASVSRSSTTMAVSRLALALVFMPSVAMAYHHSSESSKCDLKKDDITELFAGLHACYDHALNNKCDTSCVREFYLDDKESSSFSWFDGALGGSAYGLDEIVDQVHNECNLFLEQVPGTTAIIFDNELEDIKNILEGSCIALEKGENTVNFVGGPKEDSFHQRYSYVMVKPEGKKLQIYTRHASIAAPEPEAPVYRGMSKGKGKK